MPALEVLDLSYTSIKSLPPSISKLVKLQKLYLRGCEFLMELPPEIGALGNLEVLDLEGTELICLPREIGGLVKLECLKVSLDKSADEYSESKAIFPIFPVEKLWKFSDLKELSIDVDPECAWWDFEVTLIVNELFYAKKLHSLKLYLPTVGLLQRLNQCQISDLRLIVGRHEKRIISPLPPDLQHNFEKLPKCLKYVNGEGNHDAIAETLKLATALFLDHHWTIERLSVFKIDETAKVKYCLVVQCNEMKTIADGSDFDQKTIIGGSGRKGKRTILEHLRYLSVHCMKNLESIWKGPIASGGLSSLTTLALHTCPNLTTIFNLQLLCNLVHLTELIVDDCSQIKSLVSLEPTYLESDDCFLPSLEKISLLHLPELVSISSGLRIAPKLERMVIYNCPQLKSLSPMEICCHDVEEIKGQTAWWKALEWSSDQHEDLASVFVPLGRDGDLMDQLAEAVQTSLNCQVWPVVNPENEVLKSDSGSTWLSAGKPGNEVLEFDGIPCRWKTVNYENEEVKFDSGSKLEIWRKLTHDPQTRKYVLQPDFVIMMVAYQENCGIRRNLYGMDDRFIEALPVLKWRVLKGVHILSPSQAGKSEKVTAGKSEDLSNSSSLIKKIVVHDLSPSQAGKSENLLDSISLIKKISKEGVHDLSPSQAGKSEKVTAGKSENLSDSSSLIKKIGKELSICCLLHCSRSDYGSIALLNRNFHSLIRSGEIYRLRRQMGIVEHWVYFSCLMCEWEAFDPIRQRWMHLPAMDCNEHFKYSDKESFAVGTQLLSFGRDINSYVVYKYSILTNSWSSGTMTNTPRWSFGYASLGHIAIVAGGCDHWGNILSSAELYDSEAGIWITLPSMNRPRRLCSGVFMDGKFYVLGGIGKLNELTCGEVYDLNTRTWCEISKMFPLRRPEADVVPPSLAVVSNELYAASYAKKEVIKYDKERNLWVTLGNLPQEVDSINPRLLAFKACGDRLILIRTGRWMVELYSWAPAEGPPKWTPVARKHSGGDVVLNCAVMGC